jgi:hypothetical protein
LYERLEWLEDFSACFIVIFVYQQSIKFLSKTPPDWGPAKKEHIAERRALDTLSASALESSAPLTGVGYSSIGMKEVSPNGEDNV